MLDAGTREIYAINREIKETTVKLGATMLQCAKRNGKRQAILCLVLSII